MRYKLWVGGEFERTCNLKEVNRLLDNQEKSPKRKEHKIIVICDTITAVRIG